MLGFGAYSQLAFAESVTSAYALIAITAVASQGFAGTLDYEAKASTLFNSAVLSADVTALEYNADAAAEVVNVLATMSINDLLDIDAQATITPSAVTATFSNNLDYDAKANITIGSVTAAIDAYPLEDADAQATANLSTTAAYLSIYITDVDAYKIGKAFMFPVGASTEAKPIGFDAKANTTSPNVSAITSISSIDFDAEANITTGSITANVTAEQPAYIWGTAKAYPSSLFAKLRLHLDTPLPNNFPYEDYIDAYSPQRVLYISEYVDPGTSTVYVTEENNTVFIVPYDNSPSTIFINPEDYRVIIPPYVDSSTTVFIDR